MDLTPHGLASSIVLPTKTHAWCVRVRTPQAVRPDRDRDLP